jgi:alkylated DNA repair dioxygenase AlkB
LEESRNLSPSIPDCSPPIVLVNYYTTHGKIGWHRDRLSGITPEEQDLITSPIVSFSLGNKALFSYKDKQHDGKKKIL